MKSEIETNNTLLIIFLRVYDIKNKMTTRTTKRGGGNVLYICYIFYQSVYKTTYQFN
jgi:hypothetical protein